MIIRGEGLIGRVEEWKLEFFYTAEEELLLLLEGRGAHRKFGSLR